MKLFLTSSPCISRIEDDGREVGELNTENYFLDNLTDMWVDGSKLLLIAADPDAHETNDDMAMEFGRMFMEKGLFVSDVAVVDSRNEEAIDGYLWGADAIILSGGHVPTENAFFTRMNLREKLPYFDGIVMGISAGSMNCADAVYAQPELEGESIDPDYERWIPGLNLTDFNILPHYQEVKDRILDDKRLYEDITFADSYDNEFVVLVDGSYMLIDEDGAWIFGEAYVISDGEIEQISEVGDVIEVYN